MTIGRPKAQIPRQKSITVRLTQHEYEKISIISKKLNISKTEAVVRGIDLLINHKPKRYANLREIAKKNHVQFDEDF